MTKISELFTKIITFLKESKLEIKRVNWPTKDETLKYTLVVIAISVGVAIYLGGLDFTFNLLRKKFIF